MFTSFNNKIDFYSRALDGTTERHKAISSNLANINTPQYKRKYVSFEEQLKNEVDKRNDIKLSTTHNKHIGGEGLSFKPTTRIDNSNSYRIDGNNTNIDTENADLAKNSIMYNAIVKQVTGEFEKIKNVIREGSR